jgi:hypothetical protein
MNAIPRLAFAIGPSFSRILKRRLKRGEEAGADLGTSEHFLLPAIGVEERWPVDPAHGIN